MARITTLRRTATVPATPAQIRDLVASTDGFTAINPHLTADPRLRIEPYGPPTGTGAGFRFAGKDGKGTQTVSAVADDAVIYAIDMGSRGTSTQEIRIAPLGSGGSSVTWSMALDAGNNPMLRLFGLFADKVLGPTLDTGLRNLAAHRYTH